MIIPSRQESLQLLQYISSLVDLTEKQQMKLISAVPNGNEIYRFLLDKGFFSITWKFFKVDSTTSIKEDFISLSQQGKKYIEDTLLEFEKDKREEERWDESVTLSKKANTISQEANTISRKANILAILSIICSALVVLYEILAIVFEW